MLEGIGDVAGTGPLRMLGPVRSGREVSQHEIECDRGWDRLSEGEERSQTALSGERVSTSALEPLARLVAAPSGFVRKGEG